MTDRVADLTWRRPKAVLVALGVFVVVAGIAGARGRGAPEGRGLHGLRLLRASVRPSSSATSSATTRTPGSSSWSATRTASASTSPTPAVREEITRLAEKLGGVDFVGRPVDPLRPLERAEDKIRRAQRREIAAARRDYNRQVAR